MNYRDAIKEGDGQRVMTCWKYMMLLFKATNRQNYAIEAFHTLANCKLLPARQAHQLIWLRFINVHGNGIHGRNIPCDLHLNRLCKESVCHMAGMASYKVC